MKKLFRLIKICAVAVFCLIIVVFSNKVAYAQTIGDTRTGILPDKEWHINFTNNVGYDYVNSNYIYATDSLGNKVQLNINVNPLNQKQIIINPYGGKYVLGKTYDLTISKDFCDEKGNRLGKDYTMEFTIKTQLVDIADFKVKILNYGSGIIGTVSINSTTLSNAKTYRVEGQDEKDDNVNIGDEAYIYGNFQNVNVTFYDEDGKKIGSCLLNIEKTVDSKIVNITN